jgi:hypothetical protein
MGHSPAGLYGYTHMLGGFAGGQAEYARVPFADVGALKIPDGLPDEKGAVYLRYLSHRLHGGGELQYPARRYDRGSGAAAPSGSLRSRARACSEPSA